MSTKRCKWCGAYLDPDEWCKCESSAPDAERRWLVRPRRKSYDQLYAEYSEKDGGVEDV